MINRYAVLAVVAGLLVSAAPAARAGTDSVYDGYCSYYTIQRDTDVELQYPAGRHLQTGVLYARVLVYSKGSPGDNPVSATVTCDLWINGETRVSATFSGTGIITGAKRVSFYTSLTEEAGICTSVDFTSDDTPSPYRSCPIADGVAIIPGAVYDAVAPWADPLLDTVNDTTPPVPVPPECSDGVDNDQDGAVDYPADTDCAGPDYDAEGLTIAPAGPPFPRPCATVAAVTACASLTPRDTVAKYTVYESSYLIDRAVDAVLARYEFTLPNGGSVVLPCVKVVTPVAADPCAAAGGTYVNTVTSLVEYDPLQNLDWPAAEVEVCTADLTVTVNGEGVSSAPAYALC